MLAIPAAVVGYLWSVWRGRKITHAYVEPETGPVEVKHLPAATLAFLPIILPIALIGSKSIIMLYATPTAGEESTFLKLFHLPVNQSWR